MGELNVLNPAGPAASEISFLWWLLFWTATVVGVIVFGLLLFALRGRKNTTSQKVNHQETKKGSRDRFILIGGGLIPALILIVIFGFALRSMIVLAGPPAREEAITIQAVGHQWWWEIRYPNEAIVTANELWLPVGERVRLEVTGGDVIHSFWVPNLHGKIDTIPGQTNVFWLEASRAGLFRGECAEFCGLQHANMAFMVNAVERGDFEAWLERQRTPVSEFVQEQYAVGKAVFQDEGCAGCHAVRGTPAQGQLGPDLTHIASRMTLGAGILENNRGNLAGWTVNAQAHKPGNKMPPIYLEGDRLQALLDYLEGLE